MTRQYNTKPKFCESIKTVLGAGTPEDACYVRWKQDARALAGSSGISFVDGRVTGIAASGPS
jgi:hypothetical protein